MKINVTITGIDSDAWKIARQEAIRQDKKMPIWIAEAIMFYRDSRFVKLDFTNASEELQHLAKDSLNVSGFAPKRKFQHD